MKARCKGRVKEAAALVDMSAMALRLTSPRPARPCDSTTASNSNSHSSDAALRNTWMDVGAYREIHPSTYIRC